MQQGLTDVTARNLLPVCHSGCFDTEQFFGTSAGLFTVELGRSGPSDQTVLDLASQMRHEKRHVLGHIQIKGTAKG